MYIESFLKEEADNNGIFIANVSVDDTHGNRCDFRDFLRSACYEAGVVCGVSETKDGFRLGFEHPDDYTAVMAIVDGKIAEYVKLETARCVAILKAYDRPEEEIESFRRWSEGQGDAPPTPDP